MAARSPTTRIDEVNIAQNLRGWNHHVPVNHRPNISNVACVLPRVPLDRPKAAVANGTRRVELIPANTVHVTPIVERAISVHEANDTLLSLDVDRQRQSRQALSDAGLLGARNLIQPFATMHPIVDFRVRIAKRRTPDQKVMVPTNSVKPRTIQPGQHLIGLRAAIDKITDRKQAIDALVEPDRFEGFTQQREATVNIAHREISTGDVARKSAHGAASGRACWRS